ncbi:MAG: hypothetical protein LBS08_02365 [Candidatus Symbiothrix sp.]|jgi:hypothetical protein|nr:hypothetical protein [Candidatus Symbiothrix sp.]
MKKTILLINCIFAIACSYGQVSDNGLVIRLDGNYNETSNSNLLQSVNSYSAASKEGGFLLSAGYKYRNWVWGLGFEYTRSKTEALGQLFEFTEEALEAAFAEQSAVTLNAYGGALYVSRYVPIWRNLYFTPGFYLGYGRVNGDYSGTVISIATIPVPAYAGLSSVTKPIVRGYEQSNDVPYFYTQLSPELTWFFSDHFGVNLQTGGLGITVVDSDWENSAKQVNFNPSLWKLGIVIKL